jgi:hypothetical protein
MILGISTGAKGLVSSLDISICKKETWWSSLWVNEETGKCGICNVNKGEMFCFRCKRAICGHCWNEEWDLCADCAAYKQAEKWNLSQGIRNAQKSIDYSKAKIGAGCSGCLILRDHLLYLLKKMKDTEYTASTELIPDIGVEAKSAREMLTDLSIRVVVSQKMKAPRDPSSKL